MKKRLAAFDLDGTLLTDRKTITEQTREAVRRAIESSIQVAFCTGRTRLECVDVIEALPEVRYLIASSGARIWDLHENRVAAEDCFPPEISKALVDRLVRFHVLASVFTVDRIAVQPEWRGQYAKHFDDVWAPHFERFYTPVDDYLNYAAGGHGAVEKIFAVFLSHEERDAAWKAIEGIPCESGDSAADNLELTPVIDKINVQKARRNLGVSEVDRHIILLNTDFNWIGRVLNQPRNFRQAPRGNERVHHSRRFFDRLDAFSEPIPVKRNAGERHFVDFEQNTFQHRARVVGSDGKRDFVHEIAEFVLDDNELLRVGEFLDFRVIVGGQALQFAFGIGVLDLKSAGFAQSEFDLLLREFLDELGEKSAGNNGFALDLDVGNDNLLDSEFEVGGGEPERTVFRLELDALEYRVGRARGNGFENFTYRVR